MGEITSVKSILDQQFKIKDLGTLKFFLGLDVARSFAGLILSQRKYALELLEDVGLLACKLASTPMLPGLKLSTTTGTPLTNPTIYRRLIGRLIYLTNTQPDICCVVHKLSQFLSKPLDTHMAVTTYILKYIKGSPGHGLFYSSTSDGILKAFSDADWATCLDGIRSIDRFSIFYGSSLISWKSKKQSVVSRSSSEAEYKALVLKFNGYFIFSRIYIHLIPQLFLFTVIISLLYIHIAQNPIFHERTKNVELDCHLIRDKVQAGTIHLMPIPTNAQIADI